MRTRDPIAFVSVLALLVVTGSARGAAPFRVSSFTPEGTVKEVRQVRAGFSEPVVAFGDPRAADPFDVRCPAPGKGRWADAKNWIYDFDADLPAGLRCEFIARAGLKAVSGAPLDGRAAFAFDTGGPAVKRSDPWEGSQIEEGQYFVLALDAEADPRSVEAHAYFTVEGLPDPIPAKVYEGDPRNEAAKSMATRVRLFARKFGFANRVGTRRAGRAEITIHAGRPFPPKARVNLVWGKGVATPSGAATQEDQTLAFETRPEFTATFNCERENAGAPCLPISNLTLSFSAPVNWRDARRIRLRSKSGREIAPSEHKDGKLSDDDGVSSVVFAAPLPEATELTLEVPKGLRDDSGRPLANAASFPLRTATAEYPPLAKFPAEFGILELKPEALLPVTLRNLEPGVAAKLLPVASDNAGGGAKSVPGKTLRLGGENFVEVLRWISRVGARTYDYKSRDVSLLHDAAIGGKTSPLAVPKPNGARAFEVVGIPLPKPGFYVVELESAKLGKSLLESGDPMYVQTSALVTNLSVHFKKGRESSLVWVTRLDDGKPVEGAAVSLVNCRGNVVGSGTTGDGGIWVRRGELPEPPNCERMGQYSSGLSAVAQKEGDFSFTHTSWNTGIESWRFQVPRAYPPSPALASTVFDRTLLRAGETVHMKHFARRHTMGGIISPARGQLPGIVQIRHEGSDQKYELPLAWRDGDVAETIWKIPEAAKLGNYRVALLEEGTNDTGKRRKHRRGGGATAWESGEFRVEEYRVPLMKGQLKTPPQPMVAPKSIPAEVSVEYLAGGAATALPIQVRHQQSLAADPIEFPAFEGYSFGTGRVRADEGSGDEPLPPGVFEIDLNASAPDETRGGAASPGKADKQALTLDKGGTAHVEVPVKKVGDRPERVAIELEYADPNGETQTVARSVPVYPASRLIAVRPDGGFVSKSKLKFQVAVSDLAGHPVADAPVEVDYFERKTSSHRKRLVGGFYSYDNRSHIEKAGAACAGKTDSKGLLDCEGKPPAAGNILLEARVKDEAGHLAYGNVSTWVYGSDEWWFEQTDSDRIDLLPEKRRYEAGDKAVFQVRMPFREATALVTVEREGVLDSFTVPLSGRKPLVEVPIKPSYAPNVFVSVLAVRGRVGDVQPTALVDLGRPAYKLGLTEIKVGWKPHELKVAVQPSKDVYQVRERAKFRVRVSTAAGDPLPKGSEVALAAVDEGLLQLKPNDSWKLLDAMMTERGHEIDTSTAQGQVVGKRHFGLKAQPAGGDGGRAPSRELFDTLLYWNGHVTLDAHGEAEVEFPMNDSITAFRIAAVASAGADRFGTGFATVRTTQDLMILAGVPPLAREGDRLPVGFTLRNTTAASMNVEIAGTVREAPGRPELAKLPAQRVALAAGEAKIVSWPLEIPPGHRELSYEVEARAEGPGTAPSDRLHVAQKVRAALPVRVYQATLTQLDGRFVLPVLRPVDAVPGKGGIRVQLEPTLMTGLGGVREYMADYPYTCIEQRASQAVALRDETRWKALMKLLPSHLDDDGLVRYFPSSWILGSEILTSYLLAIADEAGWEIPDDVRGKMIAGLQGFVEGRVNRLSSLPAADVTVRKVSALEALSRYGEAKWSMATSFKPELNLWPTSALIDWRSFLGRVSGQKDAGAPADVSEQIAKADGVLRSRLNFQGTTMGFSTENVDALWWMMVSTSVNANRFLLTALQDPAWKDDIGRLARGALGRQQRGHWDTTTANAWGALAVEKFVAAFEKTPVAGETVAKLGAETAKTTWSEAKPDKLFDFAWPAAPGGAPAPGTLEVAHAGAGKPWLTVQSRAAIPLREPLSSGYRLKKTWKPVEQRTAGKWTRGDIVRVRLEMESQSDMTWVVVNDPIPAGAAILGSGLGNDSGISTGGEKAEGWAQPAFQERAFDGFRAYYEYVPKGKWAIEYTVRLNQAGHMTMPATRIEAMYAPEMFGELPNDTVEVQ